MLRHIQRRSDGSPNCVGGGGEGAVPVYAQLLKAGEDFFPESGILQDDGVQLDEQQQTGGYPLQRVNSGVSSLVGHNNGERPGGFVLVIDGAALTHVRIPFGHLGARAIVLTATRTLSRPSATRSTSTSSCGSRCSARASSAAASRRCRRRSS